MFVPVMAWLLNVMFAFAARFPALAGAHEKLTEDAEAAGPLDAQTCALVRLAIALGAGAPDLAGAAVEGAILANYETDSLKTDPKKNDRRLEEFRVGVEQGVTRPDVDPDFVAFCWLGFMQAASYREVLYPGAFRDSARHIAAFMRALDTQASPSDDDVTP